MRYKTACEVFALALGVAGTARADTFEFRVAKQTDKWVCTAGHIQEAPGNVKVNVLLPAATANTVVALKATVSPSEGTAIVGDLTKSDVPGGANLWTFASAQNVAKVSKVALSGSVENQAVTCEKAATNKPDALTAVGQATFTAFDLAAASWLDGDTGQKALRAIRTLVERDNPDVSTRDIKLLPHLPSGAKAPSYPTSISERQIGQVVLLIPPNESRSVDWTLTRCETIPTYRVSGDLAALQTEEVDFKVVRIGNVLSCGADKLEYSIDAKSDPGQKSDPVATTLTVRPVYHLGATAVFGFDTTKESAFQIRDGKITESVDRIGPGLMVGGTYFIKGVDYADMRWYHHIANPFVAISPAAPKEHFVIGTTLTYRGGLSAAVGMAFNHVPILADGASVGQTFAGPGDIPQNKTWKYSLYVGIAVDDKLYASFKKLDKGGTGGGTKAPAETSVDKSPANGETTIKDQKTKAGSGS
jgi:hypothetical protein